MSVRIYIGLFVLIVLGIISCEKDPFFPVPEPSRISLYDSTPYELDLPANFPEMIIPEDNPLTKAGVELGRMLFYDPILSKDSTQSCSSCHKQENAFTESKQFSVGVDGMAGNRNSMPIFNLGWQEFFFWDGRAQTMEEQALGPVRNPIEMHERWGKVAVKLNRHPSYPDHFERAFNTREIDSTLVVKAIAQFERTLLSFNSKYDKYARGEVALTLQELNGLSLFLDQEGADCFHCHGAHTPAFLTTQDLRNNGLDGTFTDLGYGKVTNDPNENGKFKVPSLRNLLFTSPYMHDGRFATLEEVVDFYSSEIQISTTIHSLIEFQEDGGVQLTAQEKADLVAFLKTLTDSSFVTNSEFKNPF